MPSHPSAPHDEHLPNDIVNQLQAAGIVARGEVELRQELERFASSYTLFRLNPIAARKWKARYRIMLAADYLDCQSVAEAYARALLSVLPATDAPVASDATKP